MNQEKTITASVIGGDSKMFSLSEAETISELKRLMGVEKNYRASVNGDPIPLEEHDKYELNDYEFVSFSPAVKGGHKQ